ncbi:hypothetical protein [Streptomyces natalensis]|uniref:hypothetical protein n=1 Tax=Streptomyces natalensis TaxID=68242 RepID=UPI0012FEF9AE|nr:hypothetical protein [Streptomyces natalensis]
MSGARPPAHRTRPYLDIKIGGLKVVLQERPRLRRRLSKILSGAAIAALGAIAYQATGWHPFL